MNNSARLRRVDDDRQHSFESFYTARFDWAVRLAYGLTGDRGIAENIAQEAFMRMSARFAAIDQPAGYLRASIVNGVHSHGRRQLLERRHRPNRPDESTPSHLIEFADVLNALPLKQRTVIVLRYLEGCDDGSIAALLSCRPGTVRSLAHRGLQTLKERLS
jgi:RNA polymerase sigma factor (sigma-70 family)